MGFKEQRILRESMIVKFRFNGVVMQGRVSAWERVKKSAIYLVVVGGNTLTIAEENIISKTKRKNGG